MSGRKALISDTSFAMVKGFTSGPAGSCAVSTPAARSASTNRSPPGAVEHAHSHFDLGRA